MDKIEVYKQMINKYGKKAQMLIAVEEMSELQKEILKFLRGRCNQQNIAEELEEYRKHYPVENEQKSTFEIDRTECCEMEKVEK